MGTGRTYPPPFDVLASFATHLQDTETKPPSFEGVRPRPFRSPLPYNPAPQGASECEINYPFPLVFMQISRLFPWQFNVLTADRA
jgi:hypothetical protein